MKIKRLVLRNIIKNNIKKIRKKIQVQAKKKKKKNGFLIKKRVMQSVRPVPKLLGKNW